MEYQSQDIDQLMLALMESHKEFGVVLEKDKKGHKGTYASLPCVLDSIHIMCSKHGLILTQASRVIDGQLALETILRHPKSKQWISCQSILTPADGLSPDQSWGGSSTYHRRYDAMALMGISSSDDPADHDGNKGLPQAAVPKQSECISASQLGLLRMKLKSQPEREASLLKAYNIPELAALPWRKMDEVVKVLDTPKGS